MFADLCTTRDLLLNRRIFGKLDLEDLDIDLGMTVGRVETQSHRGHRVGTARLCVLRASVFQRPSRMGD